MDEEHFFILQSCTFRNWTAAGLFLDMVTDERILAVRAGVPVGEGGAEEHCTVQKNLVRVGRLDLSMSMDKRV